MDSHLGIADFLIQSFDLIASLTTDSWQVLRRHSGKVSAPAPPSGLSERLLRRL
jgi:hypothetical protein